MKVIYLAIQKASKKWTMSLHDWRSAMNRFAIEFEGRLPSNNNGSYTELFTGSNLDSILRTTVRVSYVDYPFAP